MNFIQATCILILFYGKPFSCLQCHIISKNSTDCSRECEFPARPRVCEFEFTVAWWYTMAAGCLDCPDSKSDCSSYHCYSVDGSQVPILSVNDSSPGPSIQVCHGDIIRVKVNNQMLDGSSLTIHWHGIHQFETLWADGVPMITQCPIPSSSSFVYKFVADPPGTHWWHSHVGVQRGDALYGALIVSVPRQTEVNSNEYDFDIPEHYMIFNEWLTIMSLDSLLLAAANVVSPRTVTIVTNGKGVNDNIGVDVPVSVFEVEQGYRYRMRAINGAFGECNIKVTIESHPITVIANDGFELEPVETDSFVFAPGERIDFVLEASQRPSSYCIYINTIPFENCPGNGSAILQYKNLNAKKIKCTDRPETKRMFSTMAFQAFEKEVTTLKDTRSYYPVDNDLYIVDEKLYLVLQQYLYIYRYTNESNELIATTSTTYTVNGAEFVFPESPFVSLRSTKVDSCPLNNVNETKNCTENYCGRCTIVAKVQIGQVVEFVFVDDIGVSDHPMHLHGQSFRVLAQGYYNASYTATDLISYDKSVGIPRLPLESTVVKDTLNIPVHGYGIIRWKAENPGYWFFHCHIEYHALLGMAIVIQVGEDDEIPGPPAGFPICEPWSPD